jgi:hypothetical protein
MKPLEHAALVTVADTWLPSSHCSGSALTLLPQPAVHEMPSPLNPGGHAHTNNRVLVVALASQLSVIVALVDVDTSPARACARVALL